MPSVTTPGLSTAPTGVTSFVPSLRVIALLDGIDILDSTLDRRPPLRGRRRPARGRRAPPGRWRDLRLGRAPRRQRSPGPASRRTARTCSWVNPHVGGGVLSSDYLRTTK